LIASFSTSLRTCGPYCFSISLSGTLPGLKPAIFAVRARRERRLWISASIVAIGTDTLARRCSAESVSRLLCMLGP